MSNRLALTSLGVLTMGLAGAAETGAAQQTRGASPSFETIDTLLDASVRNQTDSQQGAINDLIVDARNGRIVYAVIGTGKMMGLDSRTLAIPYGALAWDPSQKTYTIHATAENLRNLPAFRADDIANLQDEGWLSLLQGVFGDRTELRTTSGQLPHDEYTWMFADMQPQTITGTVHQVSRDARSGLGNPLVSVSIAGDTTPATEVLLAPMAFLAREGINPQGGDTVTISAILIPAAGGKSLYIARHIKLGENAVDVRDRDGVPAWTGTPRGERQMYKLASNLSGGNAFGKDGAEFGNINDAIFEAHSGQAAFAVVSVGGVLGVDDTLYPIPCGAFTMGRDQSIHIGQTAEQLAIAPKFSEQGAKDLQTQGFIQQIHTFFKLTPKTYELNRAARWQSESERTDR